MWDYMARLLQERHGRVCVGERGGGVDGEGESEEEKLPSLEKRLRPPLRTLSCWPWGISPNWTRAKTTQTWTRDRNAIITHTRKSCCPVDLHFPSILNKKGRNEKERKGKNTLEMLGLRLPRGGGI